MVGPLSMRRCQETSCKMSAYKAAGTQCLPLGCVRGRQNAAAMANGALVRNGCKVARPAHSAQPCRHRPAPPGQSQHQFSVARRHACAVVKRQGFGWSSRQSGRPPSVPPWSSADPCAAKRQHGAARARPRVGAGLALGVDTAACGSGCPARRCSSGRRVRWRWWQSQNIRVGAGAGPAEGDGVGAEKRLAASHWRHPGMAGCESQSRQAVRGDGFNFRPQGRKVEAMANDERAQAVALRRSTRAGRPRSKASGEKPNCASTCTMGLPVAVTVGSTSRRTLPAHGVGTTDQPVYPVRLASVALACPTMTLAMACAWASLRPCGPARRTMSVSCASEPAPWRGESADADVMSEECFREKTRCQVSASVAMRAGERCRAGCGVQPYSTCAAAPQMRPGGAHTAAVCSLRRSSCCAVAHRAPHLRSGRPGVGAGRNGQRVRAPGGKWRCSASANAFQRASVPCRACAASVWRPQHYLPWRLAPAHVRCRQSRLHSPAAYTPGTVVCISASTCRPPRSPGAAQHLPQMRVGHQAEAAGRCDRTPTVPCRCPALQAHGFRLVLPRLRAHGRWRAGRGAAGGLPGALAGQRTNCAANTARVAPGCVLSRTRSTCARPCVRWQRRPATKGPVPAMTMRWPRTPPAFDECLQALRRWPGSVQPGRGSSSSRAPVQRMVRPVLRPAARGVFQNRVRAHRLRARAPRPTTRVPPSTSMLAWCARPSRYWRASVGSCTPGPSRQICPPGRVVVHHHDAHAARCGSQRRRHAGGPRQR